MTGTHIIIDISNISNNEKLKYSSTILPVMDKIVEQFQLKVVEKALHQFEPSGFTGVYVLSESHLSIHTFVEEREPFTYRVRVWGISRRGVPGRLMYDSGDVLAGNQLNVCRSKLDGEGDIEVEVTQTAIFATWRIQLFCSECNPLP
jgi:hypothetical protein